MKCILCDKEIRGNAACIECEHFVQNLMPMPKVVENFKWTKRQLLDARHEAHTQWLNAKSKEQSDYYSNMFDHLTILIGQSND